MKDALFVYFLLIPYFLFAQTDQKVILAGGLVNVNEGTISKDVLIIIEQNKIANIFSSVEKGNYDNIIDLSEYTILPGLIDCHTHLTGNWYLGQDEFDIYTLPSATYGIIGTVNAKKTLYAGFTTVRDLHSYFYGDVALRDAINKGWIPGPRMYVSGPGLSITGGHGSFGNWLSPQMKLKPGLGNVADGEDEVRKVTRELIKYGVDWIKIFATGGFSSQGTIPGAASYSEKEMTVAVEEAHKNGIRVAAHAHGVEGIKNALRAGVQSIEHATFMDQECIDLFKEKDAFLSMDLLGAYYDLIESNNHYNDKKLALNNQKLYDAISVNFKQAYDQGVKMVFGTDAGVYPHGRNAEQFILMKQAGMKEIDIIRSATINAAKLIGIQNNAGSLEIGKWADLIALKGNPLEDITVMEKIMFIMKDGRIFKNFVKY